MNGSENDVVLARLKALQDTIKGLKPGKSDATIVAVVQEVLGFLGACSAQEVINLAIKVLEDGIVLSPQAGTILRLEGGLKQVIKHLKAATALPAVAGPCARILAVAAATSTVTQQALAKEKALGLVLLNTCALHVRDPSIAGPLCETMAHVSRASKGAVQLECDGLLPVLQELLVSYLGNWPVFGWVLKLMKNLAKYEYAQNGAGAVVGTGVPAGRGGCGVLTTGGEAVRMLLGVARVLARIPEQRKLLKRVSRTLWLLCPHVLLPVPPLEPLVPLPPKDAPHLTITSAGESDPQRNQELFPEDYPWQQLQPPQLLPLLGGAQQQQQQAGSQAGAPSLTVRPTGAVPVRPPSARQTCRSLAVSGGLSAGAADLGVAGGQSLGQTPEPFHGYGSSLDCEMMLHDLQRIANPRGLVNRIVYMNTGGSGSGGGPAQGTGAGGGGAAAAYSLREQSGSRAQTQATPSDASGWSWGESTGGRAPDSRNVSGVFPDLARLGVADAGAAEGAAPGPGPGSNASAARTPSPSELDSFRLPLIGGDPWARAESSNPVAQRLCPRSSGQGGGASGASSPRPQSPAPPPLTFHSCFESGNLRCAAQVGPREYDLFLAPDLNDRSEGGNLCQWFYFAVTVPPGACSGAGWPQSGTPVGRGAASGSGGPAAAPPSQPASSQYPLAAEPPLTSSSDGGGGGANGLLGLGQGPGIKMNIVNLRKKESLFTVGKRPVICLARPAEGVLEGMAASGAGPATTPRSRPGSAPSPVTDPGVWFRAGSHISYYPSPYRGRPTVAGEGAATRKGKKPSVASVASVSTATTTGTATGGGGATGTATTNASPSPVTSSSAPSARKGKSKAAKGSSTAAADGTDGDGAGCGPGSIGPGLYCATFTLHFPVPGTYYVASCYPYTYSDLQDYLDGLQRRLAAASSTTPGSAAGGPRPPPAPLLAPVPTPPVLVRSLLCYTLSGLRVELLTITDWGSPMEVVRQRECIFITARVHPGETCASWLMQGLLEFLVSSDPAAVTLRSSFVFKLVPMLNPDGVVNGNYRCSLAGVDLNRVWDRPLRFLYPSVFHAKRVLQQLAAAGRLALYIDVHGHSTKSDTFFYGCEPTAAALQAHSTKEPRGAVAPTPATAASAAAANLPYPNNPRASVAGPAAVAGPDGDFQQLQFTPLMPQALQQQQQQALQGCYGPSVMGPPGGSLSNSPAGPGGVLTGSGLAVQGNGFSGNGTAAGLYGMYGGGPMVPQQQQQQQPAGQMAGAALMASPPPPTTTGPSARVAARLRVRMLPYLTARLSSDFSYPKCSFKIRKAKLSAARVVVHRELGVAGSYTLEASLAGSSTSAAHFSARDYLAMGHNLCRAICELAEVDDTALLEEMNARLTLPPL